MKKILAISSIGGHWIQLLRLVPAFKEFEVIYASTHDKCATMIPQTSTFYTITDFSRWNPIKVIPTFFTICRIFIKESPDVVISTGAAPGLIAILIGRLFLKKTIWVDSIANVEKLSLSGRVASKIAHRVYTQWEHLADNNIIYKGNILS